MRRTARVASVVAMTAALALVPAAAAHADLNDDANWTLGDCQWQEPGTVDVTQTVVLNASNGFTATFGSPTNIWWGDAFEITATGTINDGGWPTSGNWDANGSTGLAPSGGYWPVAGVRKYSLAGIWNSNGRGFFIGAGRGCWSTRDVNIGPTSTQTFLFLTMNDEERVNNSGSWTVRIRQWFREGT
jgi:hypothetical protein